MSDFRLRRLLELYTKEEEHRLYACRQADSRRKEAERRLESLLRTIAGSGPTAGRWTGMICAAVGPTVAFGGAGRKRTPGSA